MWGAQGGMGGSGSCQAVRQWQSGPNMLQLAPPYSEPLPKVWEVWEAERQVNRLPPDDGESCWGWVATMQHPRPPHRCTAAHIG